jgi:hypothetical protein
MPDLQRIILQLEVEFDNEQRVQLCQDAERDVLKHWGGGYSPQYLSIANILYHNYLHVGETTNFSTVHNYWRDYWFDQTDPSWDGRPA